MAGVVASSGQATSVKSDFVVLYRPACESTAKPSSTVFSYPLTAWSRTRHPKIQRLGKPCAYGSLRIALGSRPCSRCLTESCLTVLQPLNTGGGVSPLLITLPEQFKRFRLNRLQNAATNNCDTRVNRQMLTDVLRVRFKCHLDKTNRYSSKH